MVDKAQFNDISKVILQVFPKQELKALSPTQVRLLESMIGDVINKEGLQALTKPRMEGLQELLEAHLFLDMLKLQVD